MVYNGPELQLPLSVPVLAAVSVLGSMGETLLGANACVFTSDLVIHHYS